MSTFKRLEAEQTPRIDLRLWRKAGHLHTGNTFTWSWSRGGAVFAQIAVAVQSDALVLHYRVDGGLKTQAVTTSATPCRFGGSRLWLHCHCCGARSEVLYIRHGWWGCRKCLGVCYASQNQSARGRANARYLALQRAVGSGKPKWQRWPTYYRLERERQQASRAVAGAYAGLVKRLRGR